MLPFEPGFSLNLKVLREVAEQASPGPWEVNGDDFPVCSVGNSSEDGKDYYISMNGRGVQDGCNDLDAKTDAEFIALFNPKTVLALINRIEELENVKTD